MGVSISGILTAVYQFTDWHYHMAYDIFELIRIVFTTVIIVFLDENVDRPWHHPQRYDEYPDKKEDDN